MKMTSKLILRLILAVSTCTLCSLAAFGETSQEVGTFESTVDEVLRSKEILPRNVLYNLSLQTSMGSVNTGANNISNIPQGADNISHFNTITPQFGAEFRSGFISSAYVNMPLYWDSSTDTSSSRTLGRPELGLSKTVVEKEDYSAELGFALKLPLYEDSSGYYPDGNRVFQFAPSLTTDARLFHTRFHFVTASRLSYDTKAQVALPVSPDGDVKGTGLERPLSLRVSAGLEFNERLFSVGLGLKTVNWLGVGRVTGDEGVLREVAPADLLQAELTGSYQLQRETKINVSITQGLKTHSDFYALIQQDAPEEIASGAVSLGLVQNF